MVSYKEGFGTSQIWFSYFKILTPWTPYLVKWASKYILQRLGLDAELGWNKSI